MAQLTAGDYGRLRRDAYRAGAGKEELKALPNLPNEAQLKAAFQAIEDGIVAALPAIKVQVDVALGVTTSQALFRKLLRQWLRWRDAQGG